MQRWVKYARISPNLISAVLVAEDSAFWQHEGVDFKQIKESMEVNLERMEFARGASTITQQLAKNLYLSPSKNPARKVRELLIARRLEAELTKQRILELYLNVIEWGNGIYGAEAAARTYFGKSAAELVAARIRAARRGDRQPAPAGSGASDRAAAQAPGNDLPAHGRRAGAAGDRRASARARSRTAAHRRRSRRIAGPGDAARRACEAPWRSLRRCISLPRRDLLTDPQLGRKSGLLFTLTACGSCLYSRRTQHHSSR